MRAHTKIQLLITAGLTALALVTAETTGRWLGDRQAKAAFARLSVIWSDMRTLPLGGGFV